MVIEGVANHDMTDDSKELDKDQTKEQSRNTRSSLALSPPRMETGHHKKNRRDVQSKTKHKAMPVKRRFPPSSAYATASEEQKQEEITESFDGSYERKDIGAVGIPGTNTTIDSLDLMDDVTEELAHGPSIVVATQLIVNTNEEAQDFIPAEIWDKKVQEEVETRLLQHQHNIAVAEVVPISSTIEGKRSKWCKVRPLILLFVILVVTGIVAGVVTATRSKENPSEEEGVVVDNKRQQQDRLWAELKPWLNRTNTEGDFEPFKNLSSPQSLALAWLLNDTITLSETTVTQKVVDRYALAVLYFSTDGSNWKNGLSFLTDTDVCEWNNAMYVYFGMGVSCQDNTYMIFLAENDLHGTLPWELTLLSQLRSLDMSGNLLLSGTIPSELGRVPALWTLQLNDNALTGTFPTELGQLINLKLLYLQSNRLTGKISNELGRLSSLELLYVHENMLTGSIPTELGQVTKLLEFEAKNNFLTGSIPTEVGRLVNLKRLHLDSNSLTGILATELSQLTGLVEFSAFNNSLTGTLPTELNQMVALELFNISHNMFTGTVPTDLVERLGASFSFGGNNFTNGQ